jgi:hypothetical protein
MQSKIMVTSYLIYAGRTEILNYCWQWQKLKCTYIIVNQFAIKPLYTILDSCHFVMHDTTYMYLTIQIQHNTVTK